MRLTGFRCFECNGKADQAHHVVPYSVGGTRTIPLCESCHSKVHGFETMNMSELVKSGIKKARALGGRHGRPKRVFDLEQLRAMRESGMSYQEMAKELKTCRRRLSLLLEE